MTSNWLKEMRWTLTLDKSKQILLKSKWKRFDNNNSSIKINGCKRKPTSHVKYRGLYLDKNLSHSGHINQSSKKLNNLIF